jgi:hypothetical protein
MNFIINPKQTLDCRPTLGDRNNPITIPDDDEKQEKKETHGVDADGNYWWDEEDDHTPDEGEFESEPESDLDDEPYSDKWFAKEKWALQLASEREESRVWLTEGSLVHETKHGHRVPIGPIKGGRFELYSSKYFDFFCEEETFMGNDERKIAFWTKGPGQLFEQITLDPHITH